MKKNKCSVQNIAFVCNVCVAFVAVCIALLAGCAGFTEDCNTSAIPGGDADLLARQFASAQVTQSGVASVDESQSTLVFVFETIGGCFKIDSAFVWNDAFYKADSMKYYYTFLGDTLVLTDSSVNHDTGLPTYTSMSFIGGDNGVLDGIWKMLPCISYAGYNSCRNFGVNIFIQINEGKLEIRESDEDFDYMSSGFIEYLFSFVNARNRYSYSELSLESLFAQSLSLDRYFTQEDFVVVSKTNKNMTFTHDGRSYALNVVYASRSDSAVVSFSSGNDSCFGHYRKVEYASSELCREEFADYLNEKHLYKEDLDLWDYKNDNYKEFGSCISNLLKNN